ncbi:MAG: hypothetical protein ACR2RB_14125, partial [Gammaproteobacteria bacterium]
MPSDTARHASECQRFAPAPGQVGVERILRIQGYTDMDKVRPAIRRAAQAMAGIAEELAMPVVCYRRLAVATCDDQALVLADGTLFR